MLELKNKRVTVVGLSKRTGVAAVKELLHLGALVTASDIKRADQLKEELKILHGLPVEYELGGHGKKSLASDLIVVSPGVPLETPFFKKVYSKGIPVISEIELAYQLTEARIIAITGTNGKTTTTALIGEILKRADVGTVKIAGNIGIPLIQEAPQMGPEDWLVVEVSSFQLETIRQFRPYISLYLNFTPDHLDRHKTVEAYWEAKKRIFMNQKPDDYAVINGDDPEVVRAVKDCSARVLSVSTTREVEAGIYQKGNELVLKLDGLRESLMNINTIHLKGEHNRMNIAFAILVARLAGAGLKEIQDGVLDFTPAHHRMEEIFSDKEGRLIIDDSKATNPDAAVKALMSYDQPIILIAGGQDRGADFSELARIISKRVKKLILLGETKEIIRDEVLRNGFSGKNIFLVNEMGEAVKTAIKNLQNGECLLLSPGCPSWDMYPSYQHRGEHFQREVRGN